MARKIKIANDELVAIFYERMREAPSYPQQAHISIAIVPSERHGWTALISAQQRKQHASCASEVERIQKQLRAIYELKKD
jgi:hypothetical protein